MATAKRTGGKRETAAEDQTQEKAPDQPAQEEEGGARGRRRLPERMPQWRTGNPNNSGIAGGVMRRVEERWQEEHKKDKKR
jgi:hypothetical protein